MRNAYDVSYITLLFLLCRYCSTEDMELQEKFVNKL